MTGRRPPALRHWLPIAALLAAAAAPPTLACTATGGTLRCPGGVEPELGARLPALTREDINARIGAPGTPVVRDVTRDVSRTWEAVRRPLRPPAIAYPGEPAQDMAKGDTP
jgi:hypothetical protein